MIALLEHVLPLLFCLAVIVVVGALAVQPLTGAAMRGVCSVARWLDTRHQRRDDVRAVRERGQAWTREQARRAEAQR